MVYLKCLYEVLHDEKPNLDEALYFPYHVEVAILIAQDIIERKSRDSE